MKSMTKLFVLTLAAISFASSNSFAQRGPGGPGDGPRGDGGGPDRGGDHGPRGDGGGPDRGGDHGPRGDGGGDRGPRPGGDGPRGDGPGRGGPGGGDHGPRPGGDGPRGDGPRGPRGDGGGDRGHRGDGPGRGDHGGRPGGGGPRHDGGSSSGGGVIIGGGGFGGGGSTYDPSPSYPSSHGSYDSSDSFSSGSIGCAPETVSSNVSSTDRTLKALTKSSKFSSAKKFNADVTRIASLKNPNQKAAQYFQMVGINPKDSKAVVAFIGAREARGSWLVELQRNSDLSEQQAEVVASTLQTTLRGGLQ